jgi:hypothetical protein
MQRRKEDDSLTLILAAATGGAVLTGLLWGSFAIPVGMFAGVVLSLLVRVYN